MPPLGLPSLIPFAERARNPSLVRSEIKSLSNSASVATIIKPSPRYGVMNLLPVPCWTSISFVFL